MAIRGGSEALISTTVCGNAGVVQHVLWPAVDQAGQRAVEVLHRRRQAHPVVRLELRHRDDQVGVDHGGGERETLQRAQSAGVAHVAKLAVVEVDEPQLLVAKRPRPCRTPPGPSPCRGRGRALRRPATSAPQRRKTSAAASTTLGCVLICGAASGGLDQVRLQQDLPPANPLAVKAHGLQSGGDGLGQAGRRSAGFGRGRRVFGPRRTSAPADSPTPPRPPRPRLRARCRRLNLQEGNENRSGQLVS